MKPSYLCVGAVLILIVGLIVRKQVEITKVEHWENEAELVRAFRTQRQEVRPGGVIDHLAAFTSGHIVVYDDKQAFTQHELLSQNVKAESLLRDGIDGLDGLSRERLLEVLLQTDPTSPKTAELAFVSLRVGDSSLQAAGYRALTTLFPTNATARDLVLTLLETTRTWA